MVHSISFHFSIVNITNSARVVKAASAAQNYAQRKSTMQNFTVRPIQQQQAALNLAKLAKKETSIGLNETSVEALILGLTVSSSLF